MFAGRSCGAPRADDFRYVTKEACRCAMPTLIRQTFKTSRLAEFCSQKELVNQTGHAIEDWPLVILKELFDNALDGCEEAEIAPAIAVAINRDGISVTDNGAGLDAATIVDITDYTARVSSREAYSPTRGAQGNALKTILAMPFALDGERGTVTIETRGIAHTVNFSVDRIRQVPRIGEFKGLSRTQTRGTICEAVGASRWSLAQFFGNGTDLRRTGKLLDEMKRHSSAILPKALGAIGQSHLAAKLEAFGAETFEYKSAAISCDGIPYLIEAAFGYCPHSVLPRRIITGVNWSPAISDPFRNVGGCDDAYAQSLSEVLTALKAGQEEPIVFALHVACPRVDYLDRGKSAVALPEAAREAILNVVIGVTKKWTKQRKAEERDRSARQRRDERMIVRERPLNQIEAAEEAMRDAYAKASDDGQLPATARQIYYAARPLMLELTGKDTLAYNYFSQTLLLDFMGKHAEECADWDVVWDDRGHFEEPHGGEVIGLGTLSVREYLGRTKNLTISPAGFKGVAIDTCGAHGRFGALLFIEKEGFRDLFKSVRLADRYDIAIMSSKGNSVTAARQLADRICSEHDIPLLTLHDFDVYGFTIGQVGEDNKRYTFENKIKVINVGLNDILEIDDADIDAMAEPCEVRGDKDDKRAALREAGATDDENDFLLGEGEFEDYGPRRIELNALTSRQLVDLIERRLVEHEIGKVIPEADDLAEAFRQYALAPKIKEAVERAIEEMADDAIAVPADLAELVKDFLAENPSCPWEEAVATIVEETEE
jgi:hypothetical protein